MENTLVKQNKFCQVCSMAAVGLVGLIFLVLSLFSINQTCRIDQANPYAELVNFDNDFVPVNIALIVLTALLFIYMIRKNVHISKVDTRFIVFVMLMVTTIISLTWINIVQSVTSGDAMIMLNTAKDAARDNYTSFHQSYDYYGNYSYYLYYPFQLGYVFFAEILYRIFGTSCSDLLFQIPNVIALDFIYVGIVMVTKKIFDRKAVTNITAIALTVCLQPMFMTTFTYGIIIGLAFSIWSVFFTIKYIKENKLKYAGIAALLIAISVLLKYNNMIMLAAICIALILHTIDKKKFLALAVAAVMVLCSVGLQKLVIFSYSQRSQAELNTQVSQTLFAYMGISDSNMAPGWYNGLAMMTLRDNDMDVSKANEVATEGISNRLKYLTENHQLGEFLIKKFTSQLNEPAFESIWVSQVRSHNLAEGEELPKIVDSVYTGGLSKLLDIWFNYFTMMIYIGFTAGMVWMIIRRKTEAAAVILPIAVIGGVLYHMLFEAKSQYHIPYFLMLIPFAVYGLLESSQALAKISSILFRKNKPDDNQIAEE